ncbi:HGxxPAAW family protein [Streptomyces sp. CA-253872]|uniref:HGxxPAAW family protein n=1 Tax=Streptomyces sp. CA-253872 TaxID=3240067 RepID=UPI003D8C4055
MSQYDEGHTVAGWTGAAIAVAGSACLAVAVVGWTPGRYVGLVLLVVSAVVTWLLHLAGWGKAAGPRPRDQWGVRDTAARAGHPGCFACRLAGRRGERTEASKKARTGAGTVQAG